MSLYTICTDTTCPNYNTRYGSLGTTTHVECGGCQELLEVQDDGVEEILNIQNDAGSAGKARNACRYVAHASVSHGASLTMRKSDSAN